MSVAFDTNILIYAAGDGEKAVTARRLLDAGGRVSVQILNEFANVALRKPKYEWPLVEEVLTGVRAKCGPVVPVTLAVHQRGIDVARRYKLSIYDALIVAAALEAGCDTLYSEDMHHGLVVDGRLTITDPFRA